MYEWSIYYILKRLTDRIRCGNWRVWSLCGLPKQSRLCIFQSEKSKELNLVYEPTNQQFFKTFKTALVLYFHIVRVYSSRMLMNSRKFKESHDFVYNITCLRYKIRNMLHPVYNLKKKLSDVIWVWRFHFIAANKMFLFFYFFVMFTLKK